MGLSQILKWFLTATKLLFAYAMRKSIQHALTGKEKQSQHKVKVLVNILAFLSAGQKQDVAIYRLDKADKPKKKEEVSS